MRETEFIQSLLGLVIICLGVAGAYIITSIASYYNKKKDEIQNSISSAINKTDNANIDGAIKRVMTIVDNVVKALNETYKQELLNVTGDGVLTDEEKKLLRDKALELIKSEVGDGIKNLLQDVIGNFDEWIKTLIELAVAANKDKKKTTTKTTTKSKTDTKINTTM